MLWSNLQNYKLQKNMFSHKGEKETNANPVYSHIPVTLILYVLVEESEAGNRSEALLATL